MAYNVIDDFLPQADFLAIRTLLLGTEFPWYLNAAIVINDLAHDIEPAYNWQFCHIFVREGVVNSNGYKLLDPLILKLEAKSIQRVKANLKPATYRIMQHGVHTDDVPHSDTTAIYYVNDNNGMTVFEDGNAVRSRANRLLVFDSSTKHTGTTCTDAEMRCVINLNYSRAD